MAETNKPNGQPEAANSGLGTGADPAGKYGNSGRGTHSILPHLQKQVQTQVTDPDAALEAEPKPD
jgi:hypothetical protein